MRHAHWPTGKSYTSYRFNIFAFIVYTTIIDALVCVCVCVCVSISEEDTGSLRSDSEGRSGTRVGRTFSYLKNKMTRKSRVSSYCR